MTRHFLRRTRGRRSRGLRRHSTLGCPMVRNRASWCMKLCVPVDGHGACGRLAPHNMMGRTQKAIARYNALAQSGTKRSDGTE
jgi:hypothetical protein